LFGRFVAIKSQPQTKPNKTKQNQTKPNKTKQNQTKPNKTKQNNMNYHWIVFLAGVLGLVPSQMSSQPNDQMCAAKFSVIGAGLSKTGTQSIKRALESANHQVYNVESMMARRELDQVVAIHAAEPEQRAELVSQFVHQLLDDGYDATMDIPFSFLVEDCLKLDNTSTVLLSVRDSAETWFSSVEQTFDAFAGLAGWPFVWWFDFPEYASHVWQCQHSVETFQPWYLPWVKLTHRYVLDQSCVDFYTMHNNQVRQLAERYQAKLVEFNVKQGWQGLVVLNLADNLDIFPHVNTQSDLANVKQVLGLISLAWPLGVWAGVSAWFWWLGLAGRCSARPSWLCHTLALLMDVLNAIGLFDLAAYCFPANYALLLCLLVFWVDNNRCVRFVWMMAVADVCQSCQGLPAKLAWLALAAWWFKQNWTPGPAGPTGPTGPTGPAGHRARPSGHQQY
jgi:hypothetical protein